MKRILRLILLLGAVTAGLSVPKASAGMAALDPADKRIDDAQAIAVLTKLGVPLERDDRGRVRWIEAAGGELNDEAMRCLPLLPMLEWLEIGGGSVTPAGMAHLKGLKKLRVLGLQDTAVEDAGLAHLTGNSLEEVYLQVVEAKEG